MIVYLHGFASSGRSNKAQQLTRWLAPIPVLAPTYPRQPRRAVEFLLGFIRQEEVRSDRLLLIGSSLGGYYGQYLARRLNAALVLINPALDPVPVLRPYLGENRVFQTGESFEFREPDLLELKEFAVDRPCDDPVPTLVLVDRGDEVIDCALALERYRSCGQCVAFEGGDHGFAHLRDSLEYIRDLYRDAGRKSV